LLALCASYDVVVAVEVAYSVGVHENRKGDPPPLFPSSFSLSAFHQFDREKAAVLSASNIFFSFFFLFTPFLRHVVFASSLLLL